MMNKLTKIIVGSGFLMCSISLNAINDYTKDLVNRAVNKLEILERSNAINASAGNAHLNDYIINLDTAKWIEEKPDKTILAANFDKISQELAKFNQRRQDGLRFYVVVANDYKATLKKDIKINSLPNSILTRRLRGFIHKNDSTERRRFRRELGAIPSAVTKALQKKGYTETVVYFCAKIELVELEKGAINSTKDYLTDIMQMKGGRLEKKGNTIRSRVKADADPYFQDKTPDRIQKAIFNTMTAIEMVIDKGLGVDDRDPRCKMEITSLEQAVANTELYRENTLGSAVGQFTNFIKNPDAKNKWASHFVLGDNWDNFKVLGTFLREIMPDKINLVNGDFSSYTLYVVFKEINFAMLPVDWVKFTEKVYNDAEFSGKTILITVPYYKTECTYRTGFGGDRTDRDLLLMPGAWCQGNSNLASAMTSAFSTLSQNTQDKYVLKRWESIFHQAFSKIPKKFEVYNYYVIWNGDIILHSTRKLPEMVGLQDLVAINLMIDERFHEYVKIYKSLISEMGLNDPKDILIRAYCHAEDILSDTDNWEKCFIDAQKHIVNYQSKIDNLLATPKNYKKVKEQTNLVQSKIDRALANQYVQWYVGRKLPGVGGSAPGDSKFYGEKNIVHIKDILEIIDNISLVTSFIQLDFIPDAIGAYYATSKGMYTEATIYTASLALPVSAGTIKATKEGLAYGNKILTRTLKGKHVALDPSMAKFVVRGGQQVQRVGDVTKALMHNTDALQRVYRHADDPDFIAVFESELLKADNTTLAMLNGDAKLVDDYYDYYKVEKKGVDEFLQHRNGILKLGVDQNVLNALEWIVPEEGWFTVIVHGLKDGKFIVFNNNTWSQIDHRALATYIKKSSSYTNGTPIRLISCYSGDRTNQLAQNLSNKMGVEVKAPTGAIGVYETGELAARNAGTKWEFHKPGDYVVTFSNNPIPQVNNTGNITFLGFMDNIPGLPVENILSLDEKTLTFLQGTSKEFKEKLAKGLQNERGDALRQEVVDRFNKNLDYVEDFYEAHLKNGTSIDDFLKDKDNFDALLKDADFAAYYQKYTTGQITPYKMPIELINDEKFILEYFLSQGNHRLNLRLGAGAPLLDFDRLQAAAMDVIMGKLQKRKASDGLIYRGLAEAESNVFAKLAKGDEKVILQFAYASTNFDRAKDYLTFGGEKGYVFLKIKTGKAVDVSAFSMYGGSGPGAEIILERNRKFRVVDKKIEVMNVNGVDKNVTVIELEDIATAKVVKGAGSTGTKIWEDAAGNVIERSLDGNNTVYQLKRADGSTKQVGSVAVDADGFIRPIFDLPEDMQGGGILGKKIFDDMFETLGENFEIKGSKGEWLKGTIDASLFYNQYRKLRDAGKSEKEAALGTTLGKWSVESGFGKVEVDDQGAVVRIIFTKE